jgi:alkanesulfonate monooxygenase SsuD/methylene tetrahydromethanopterin reductase-like flavin-dependent oxidoreductase (luciferase family)
MHIGISTVPRGRLADPAATRALALAAEQLGYSSLWVCDPRSVHPAHPDDELDPLAVLATLAAVTSRVRLGTSVVLGPWHHSSPLARSLLSLDVLSDRRLTIGLGLGASSADPTHDTGPTSERAARLGSLIDLLDRARHRPSLLVSTHAPESFASIIHRVDGWCAAGVSLDGLGSRWERLRSIGGGSPGSLQLIVPALIELTDRPVTARRAYQGDLDQVASDLDETRLAGADEVILCLDGDPGLDETLDAYARVAEALEVRTARP